MKWIQIYMHVSTIFQHEFVGIFTDFPSDYESSEKTHLSENRDCYLSNDDRGLAFVVFIMKLNSWETLIRIYHNLFSLECC